MFSYTDMLGSFSFLLKTLSSDICADWCVCEISLSHTDVCTSVEVEHAYMNTSLCQRHESRCSRSYFSSVSVLTVGLVA